MAKTARLFLGLALLAFGVFWILGLADVLHVTLFFDGWWTLFIIIPCLCGLFTDKQKSGPAIGLGVGCLLLLASQGIIRWSDLWEYLLAIFAIIWGLTMISGKKTIGPVSRPDAQLAQEVERVDKDGRNIRVYDVSFTGRRIVFSGQRFEGAVVRARFAGVTIDLRDVEILDQAILTIECAFAGVEILAPANLNIKVVATTSFAGFEDNRPVGEKDSAPVVYIEGSCSFGGVEIK